MALNPFLFPFPFALRLSMCDKIEMLYECPSGAGTPWSLAKELEVPIRYKCTKPFSDPKFYLGRICLRGHEYEESGYTLRYSYDKHCVICKQEARKEYEARRPKRIRRPKEGCPPERKLCIKCNTEKGVGDFHRDVSKIDGLCRLCKECENARSRGWARRNRLKARARETRRYIQLIGASGSHTDAEIWQMLEDQGHQCAYCETPLFGVFHVDHMIPLSRSGSNDWTNLAITCPYCNLSKNNLTAVEYMERLRS